VNRKPEVERQTDPGRGGANNVERARRLFFKYDGSLFYMSRDGTDAEYVELRVPRRMERARLRELTRRKPAGLSRKGNWRVLNFRLHHSDYRHLAEVMAAEPKGMLWERCAFLERLLDYAKASADGASVAQAVHKVLADSRRLLRRARGEKVFVASKHSPDGHGNRACGRLQEFAEKRRRNGQSHL
jgi:hypothetical protein